MVCKFLFVGGAGLTLTQKRKRQFVSVIFCPIRLSLVFQQIILTAFAGYYENEFCARDSSGAEGVGKQLCCVQCSVSGTTDSPTPWGKRPKKNWQLSNSKQKFVFNCSV